jgi:hypothetical protein
MPKYNLEARFFLEENHRKLDDALINQLWKLFVKICEFWQTTDEPSRMKSNFLVFISNRIEVDPRYLIEYNNYVDVIEELTTELGEEEGYKKLFTDPLANIIPPITKLGRARQFVSNEFIGLNLALGGFKSFGNPDEVAGFPLNYPGYISGMNLENSTPYRKYPKP